jgi:hypothetical protein
MFGAAHLDCETSAKPLGIDGERVFRRGSAQHLHATGAADPSRRWGRYTTRLAMIRPWTNEEIRELINLWPTNSASQIGRRLHRPRSAVCGKAMRLCAAGALASTGPKHFNNNPRTPKPRRARAKRRMTPQPPPP